MSDPTQLLLQQMKAHTHSGEYLEVLGKKAAANWTEGRHKTLTEAVTDTVKQAQLSPEQVRRVVEFANTSAYLDSFRKEGSPHKVVDFPGGPADASEILKDLNDGGGGSLFDRGTSDYNTPPSETKVSSVSAEEGLASLFGAVHQDELPYANPHAEVIDLRSKIASAREHMQAEVSGLEVMYADLGDRVYHQVKQAALDGVTLGDVLRAWETVAPSEDHIKVAFQLITPRLLRDGVFHDVDQMTTSVDKTASAGTVNVEHPLVSEFGEFCETLSKLAELREARRELSVYEGELTSYLKTAAGLVGQAYDAATRASTGVGNTVRPFARKVLGDTGGDLVAGTVTHAPNIALGLGAMEAYTHLKHSPNPVARAARAGHNLVMRNIPGTQENLIHQYEVENGQ